LIVHLGSGNKLILHLKMTGSLILGNKTDAEPPQYARAIIHLDDGQNVYFRDPRKFGVMKLVADTKEIDAKLGPEPLAEDFTMQYFSDGLGKRTAPVKAFILEQKFIAGVGNMYADEALFAAGIDPRRPADSLKKNGNQKALYCNPRSDCRGHQIRRRQRGNLLSPGRLGRHGARAFQRGT